MLERALEIIALQVNDRLIPLRRALEVHALRFEIQLSAERLVLPAAWPQDLLDPASPCLRLSGQDDDIILPCLSVSFQTLLLLCLFDELALNADIDSSLDLASLEQGPNVPLLTMNFL